MISFWLEEGYLVDTLVMMIEKKGFVKMRIGNLEM